MAMSKKDYVTVAGILKAERDIAVAHLLDVDSTIVLDRVAQALATTFKADNPRFDTERFLTAAGVE